MKDVFKHSKNNLTSTWRKLMEITKMSSASNKIVSLLGEKKSVGFKTRNYISNWFWRETS